MSSDREECLTIEVKMKIWDSPRTEEAANRLFQDTAQKKDVAFDP